MQKFSKISTLAISLVAVLVLPMLAQSATAWPNLNSTIITMPTVDNSAMAWNAINSKLFTLTDKNIITKMDLDGNNKDFANSPKCNGNILGGTDFEAFTIVNPNTTIAYIGLEQPNDSILEYDTVTKTLTCKIWDLSSVMTGAANSGLEGLTFVPNAFLPAWMTTSTSGGRFYASIQRAADVGANPNRPNTATNIDDYLIYAFDIDLNNSGRIVKWDGIQYATGTPYQNISDMYFSTETGILYVLYDDSDNRLIEMNTDGTVIKDYSGIPVNGREGIVVVTNYPSDTANLYIASDSETKIVKFSGYPVTYYDRDKDRANFHVDCNDNDPTVSVNQNYYIDNDGDGLGAGAAESVCSATPPAGRVANSNDLNDNDFDNDRVSPPADCNDRDATVSSNQQYYIDNDADGVGTGVTNNICAAAPPAHYTANQQVDCNDNDPTVSANQTYYLDADGDGLGTIKETTQVCASVPPAGYVANSNDQLDAIDLDNDGVPAGQDCNDNDNTVSRIYYFYPDPDGDGKGYGRIPEQFCSSTPPAHYANNNNDVSENDFDNDGVSPPADCNDRDAAVSKNKLYYRDNDGDGVGNGIAESFCLANPPAHYTANAQVDCNDNDQTVSANQTYYSDADGDGLGTPNGAKQFCAIAPPTNFVANSNDLNDNDFDNDGVSPPADCNDRDAAVSIYQIYYADLDGDGKGSGIGEKKCLATPPMGYVANNTDQYPNDFDNDGVSPPADCNDRDATVSKNQLYYRDNDGDGVGNGIAESFCLANPPAHYTANAQVDCNDNDQTVSANQTYYLDADGDGLGSKTSISTCSANPPARYVRAGGTDRNDNDYDNDGFPANKDCNDRNPRYHRILIYYLDKDGDGLGNPRASKKFCVPPAGYVSNHRDNDDSRRR